MRGQSHEQHAMLSLPLKALTDSGAEGNFIDQQFAILSSLPIDQLPQILYSLGPRRQFLGPCHSNHHSP